MYPSRGPGMVRPPQAQFRPPGQPWGHPAPPPRPALSPALVRPALPKDTDQVKVGEYVLPLAPETLDKMSLDDILAAANVLRARHTAICSSEQALGASITQLQMQGAMGTPEMLQSLAQQKAELAQLAVIKRAIETAYQELTKEHGRKRTMAQAATRPAAATPQQQQQQQQRQYDAQPQQHQQQQQQQQQQQHEPEVQEAEPEAQQETQERDPVVTREKLRALAAQIDPTAELTPEVEEMFVLFAEEFVEDMAKYACSFAKHRKATSVEASDLITHLGVNWNMRVAGFAADPGKPRQGGTVAHRNRVANIQKAAAGPAPRR